MGLIFYNGKSSDDYGIIVEHIPTTEFPEKDYEVIHIPGRNGDVYIDNECYKNVARTYDIATIADRPNRSFSYVTNQVSNWLHSASGYARLEDTYEPEYYRMAVYKESKVFQNIFNDAGRVTITFECKPQKYLKSGDNALIFDTANTVYTFRNPTIHVASPIIKVYGSGSGSFTINGQTITVSNLDGFVVIDSEAQDCYKNDINKNSDVTLGNDYPRLWSNQPNQIIFSSGITKIEVVPKWYTI